MTDLTPELNLRLRTALKEICAIANIDPSGAQLIKYTNNAVYRLHGEGVVVRFDAGDLARQRAFHVAKVAQWLEEEDAPAVRLMRAITQPIQFEDYSATVWAELGPPDVTWTGLELAIPLMEFHRLIPPPDLREWDPFSSARDRLTVADGLGAEDHAWLTEQWSAAETEYRSMRAQMDIGLLHGDAYIGNLLRDHAGRFVLCDFDGTSRGPTEYDLVVAAVSAIRFGTRTDHDPLVATYGVDVTTLPGWPVLRRIRELVLVTSVIPDLRHRPQIATTHAHRLATLRSGADEPWRRYK